MLETEENPKMLKLAILVNIFNVVSSGNDSSIAI